MNSEIKVEYLPISSLEPYEKNTRKHNKKDIEEIALSIQKYGMNDPIGIWSDHNVIVEGHGRMMACLKLGYDVVPCIRLDHLSDAERREYAIMHNKTAELSEWDYGFLAEELPELNLEAFDIDWNLPAMEGGQQLRIITMLAKNSKDHAFQRMATYGYWESIGSYAEIAPAKKCTQGCWTGSRLI